MLKHLTNKWNIFFGGEGGLNELIIFPFQEMFINIEIL